MGSLERLHPPGGSLIYGFTDQAALRLGLVAHTAFMDSMDVITPDGSHIPLEGDTTTSISFTAGLRYSF